VQQVNAQNTGQPTMTAIATCVTASSGADTVSVSGAGGANSQIVIAEISGNFTATADATGVATSGTTPPTLSLTKAYDLFFTAGYANPENGLPSVVGPEIFVQQITGNFWALNLAYVMESSSGAYASSLNGSTYGTVIASVALLANPPSSPGVDGDWYLNTTTGHPLGAKDGRTVEQGEYYGARFRFTLHGVHTDEWAASAIHHGGESEPVLDSSDSRRWDDSEYDANPEGRRVGQCGGNRLVFYRLCTP
jgi:hypothetical protein